MNCKGCGKPVTPNLGPGRQRVWCSERCRKAQYGGTCEDCGAATYGGDGRAKAPKVCESCRNARKHAAAQQRIISAMQRWVALYGDPPAAHDWELSHESWTRSSRERRERTELRHREGGPWPRLRAVQAIFGSWSNGITAAGYEPRPVGRPRGKVAA